MLIRNLEHVRVSTDHLRAKVFARNGAVRVAETKRGKQAAPCSCLNPCGWRFFPEAPTVKRLTSTDIENLMKRMLPQKGTNSVAAWRYHIDELLTQARRMREAGLLRGENVWHMGRYPGLLTRALAHDFPDEFSLQTGATSPEIDKQIERVLKAFTIHSEYGNRVGVAL